MALETRFQVAGGVGEAATFGFSRESVGSGSVQHLTRARADGPESLGASLEAASLQRSWLELARRLYVDRTLGAVNYVAVRASLFPVLVDVAGFTSTVGPASMGEERESRLLRRRLWSAFDAEPLIAGVAHPAESVVSEFLGPAQRKKQLGWLRGVCLDAGRPNFAASVLRCLGRQEVPPGNLRWRLDLVRDGLGTSSAEIREAAVQIAEVWDEAGMCAILEAHVEKEPWLREYIEDVIEDADE